MGTAIAFRAAVQAVIEDLRSRGRWCPAGRTTRSFVGGGEHLSVLLLPLLLVAGTRAAAADPAVTDDRSAQRCRALLESPPSIELPTDPLADLSDAALQSPRGMECIRETLSTLQSLASGQREAEAFAKAAIDRIDAHGDAVEQHPPDDSCRAADEFLGRIAAAKAAAESFLDGHRECHEEILEPVRTAVHDFELLLRRDTFPKRAPQ